MTALIKYDAACRMLAEAVAVDEVQNIRNQAEAMRAYARQAKDRDLEISAAQIRFRAERRLGELIIAQKETVGLNRGAAGIGTAEGVQSQSGTAPPTLEQAGIDRKLSSRAQRMAAIEPSRFEQLLERHREEVLEGNNKVSVDLMRTSAEADGRDRRRALATVLSDASAALPCGRKFPVIYADPPWHRKQGITSRSYENHYPTMTWSEICAMPIAELLLPDAWVFLWIPRAHMFALHPVDMEFADDSGCVITRKIKLPLAWAVARAWGCDDYSTAWVWTKTDEEFPDDQGGGVIAYDQDEILLLFKRGRGLPKPDTDEKFGSNHRERSKPLRHSAKPKFYRHMIRTMAGEGVPVLELFARVDPANPMPADWEAWGNEAQIVVEVGSEAPVAVAPVDEYDALQAISLVSHRAEAALVVDGYVEQGLAFYIGSGRSDWSLTVDGWKRFQALDKERQQLAERVQHDAAACPPALQDRPSEPETGIVNRPVDLASVDADAAVPPAERPGLDFVADPFLAGIMSNVAAIDDVAPEIVDGKLQCRIPLTEHEIARWEALTALDAGETIEGEIVRDLVGIDFVHVTTARLLVTAAGREWLASLVDAPPAPPLDLPLFLQSRESAA